MKRAAAIVTVAVALVIGNGAASAHGGQPFSAVRAQVSPSPTTVAGGTTTTVLTAPTQLAPVAGEDASDAADVPNSRRRLLLLALALGLLAVLMSGFTVWFWRSTVPTPPALRPLENLKPRPPVKTEESVSKGG